MEKCKLTVVTTTYNQEKYIRKCIESIIAQKTNFNYKLLVSNDCSTDDTAKILNEYQQKYPEEIEVINHEENLGAMQNFVDTLNRVHTEYVALCDGDDFWTDENKLQKQVDYLDKHQDYSICFHQTLIFFEGNEQPDVLHPIGIKEDLTLDDLLKENMIPANTVVYRWKYLKENSLKDEFPEKIVPGDYFVHLMHAARGKIHYINEQMSAYRRQPSGMWWLSSQLDKQDIFYDKYGIPYLKFFVETEKILRLDKDVFKAQKEWIIANSLKSFIKFKRNDNFKYLYENFYDEYKELFDLVVSEHGSKLQKAYYFFKTDKANFLKKTMHYIKRKLTKK